MAASPEVTAPVFEHHFSGLGVDTPTPRISWRFRSSPSTTPGWRQTGYEIEITLPSREERPQVFNVESDQSVLVPWPAGPLASREAANVRVRVYGKGQGDASSQPGEWSPSSIVEAALLSAEDFKADFITPSQHIGPDGPLQPIRFRKTFTLPASPERARLYITALGVYNVWINGKLASDEDMAPGWTSYKHHLVYRILDVSSLLLPPGQENAICAEVGEGWYAGRLGFNGGERFRYGDELALFAQLEVHCHGASDPWTLLTDESWSAAPSAITSSEIYDGEVYNFGNEVASWALASTSEWSACEIVPTKALPRPSARLVAPDAPPVRVVEEVACKEVFRSKSGKVILDFGQNLVGKLRISRLELLDDQVLTIRHAEVMEDGELGTRPLRVAKCTDTITGATGKTLENWTPAFTFHGFRYVEVDGWPTAEGEPREDDMVALVMHTDMKRRGFFGSSNDKVNQLHSNVVWSMRGNFLAVPTDCPQRDERMGWTGDLQAFCPTATFIYDTLGMLGNWLSDLSVEQLVDKDGVVPLVVPDALPTAWSKSPRPQAVWGDVAILTPSDLYQYSGDTTLLEKQFESMKAWLDRGIKRAPDGLWDPDMFQLADWLDPSAPPEDPARASTDSTLVADAYLVHVTWTFSRLCAALDKYDLAKESGLAADKLRDQFRSRYITPDGNLVSLSQTGIALAVQFGLYPEGKPQRALAASTLDRLVRKAGFHISTGFAGTPVITHALTTIGRPQLAYRMLLETGCPSWMYPVVAHGATTIWERWDSMLPDGRINPGEMTSFNHYALGAVADWLHGSVGGISPLEPGWRVIRVRPVPGGNLTWAKVRFDGPYGLVGCEWTFDRGSRAFRMTLTVPPNSEAVVTLPSELRREYAGDEADEASRRVGSGVHEFACQYDAGEWPPKRIVHPFRMLNEENSLAGE